MGRIVVRSVVSVVALLAFVLATFFAVASTGTEDRAVIGLVATGLLTVVALWVFVAPAWVLRQSTPAR